MTVHIETELEQFLGGVTDDGRFAEYLAQSEGAVAEYIGAERLDDLTVGTPATFYVSPQRYEFEIVVDTLAPLRSITALEIDGESIDLANVKIRDPWTIEYRDPAEPRRATFSLGQLVTISAELGYDTSDQMPDPMSLACLTGAEWVRSVRPASGIASERIGDYQYSVRQAPGSLEQTLPAQAIAYLAPYVHPSKAS